MSAWTLRVPADLQHVTTTSVPTVDIDPRRRLITLGLQHRSGGDTDLWSGVLLRQAFPSAPDPVDWQQVSDWLRGDTAALLLNTISQGYSAEMLWSGDWSARWTPEARSAAQQILDQVQSLLTRQ